MLSLTNFSPFFGDWEQLQGPLLPWDVKGSFQVCLRKVCRTHCDRTFRVKFILGQLNTTKAFFSAIAWKNGCAKKCPIYLLFCCYPTYMYREHLVPVIFKIFKYPLFAISSKWFGLELWWQQKSSFMDQIIILYTCCIPILSIQEKRPYKCMIMYHFKSWFKLNEFSQRGINVYTILMALDVCMGTMLCGILWKW